MTSIVTVTAGLGSPSSTERLAGLVSAAVADRLAEPLPAPAVRVRDVGVDAAVAALGGPLAPALAAALERVGSADLLVVGTPVLRSGYAGVFKTFFDVLDRAALAGTPVLLTATGGSLRHSLVLEHQLRPLFTALGAHPVPTAVFATAAELVGPDDDLLRRVERAAREAVRLLAVARIDAPAAS